MMKDGQKMEGIWVIIAVSMLGFTLLSGLGWITLNPKSLSWANQLVGGILFGIGIVLAGGCVSGCLFKTGQGNINSMAGLIGVPLGIAAVKYGPLNGFNTYLHQYVIKNSEGGAVTLSSLTGLPYWTLALIIFGITIIGVWKIKSKTGESKSDKSRGVVHEENLSFMQKLALKRWKPWQAGIAIGVLAMAAYMSSAASGRNYPLAVTGGVISTKLLVTEAPLRHVYAPKSEASPFIAPVFENQEKNQPRPKIYWWLILEVVFLVIGSNYSARLRGSLQFKPRPPEQTVVSFFGGILLGAGAYMAYGCVVGNIMSGVALMSVGSILFAIVVIPTAWATTYFYLMGGELRELFSK